MDPASATIIAAVVTASGSLIGKVIGAFANRDEKAEKEATRVIDKAYETLRGNFTEGCVRILVGLESGNLLYPDKIREKYYPTLQLSPEHLKTLDREFRYRLEYLRLNGVLFLFAGGEYGISRIGVAFLQEARRRRDYHTELFGG